MTLTDGRGELYQWDTGRTLTVDDATITQVHYQNRAYGRTIDVDVKDGTAIIPDEILQKPGESRVYAFSGTAESGFTKVERVFNIVRRNKPNDYMFTPTEQKSLEGLQKQIGDLSNLKTDAKSDIVAAINETATAGQTLGLTGATVGQVPAVKAVDGNGAPTEWEAVELPSGAYTVNLTMGDGGNITADKTFSEIKAAHDDGKVVEAKFAGMIFHLQNLVDSEAVFAMTNANSFKVLTVDFVCTSDNVWSMSQHGFDAHTLGISGASVGQIVKIKTVDSSGVPTEWEAADMASGGSGDEWIEIYNDTFSEDLAMYPTITITDFADDYSEFELEYVLNTVSNVGNGMSVCVNNNERWIGYTANTTGDFGVLFKIRIVGKYALIIGMNACGESPSASNITGGNGGLGTGNVYLSDGKITTLGFKAYGFTAKAGSIVKVRAKR